MAKLTKLQRRELKKIVLSGQLDGRRGDYETGKKLIRRGYAAWEQVVTLSSWDGRPTAWTWRVVATNKGQKAAHP
jgi:hypothetical protein